MKLKWLQKKELGTLHSAVIVVMFFLFFSVIIMVKKLQRKFPANLTNMLSSFTFHNRLP